MRAEDGVLGRRLVVRAEPHPGRDVADGAPAQPFPHVGGQGVVRPVLVAEHRRPAALGQAHGPQRRVRGRPTHVAGVDVELAARRRRPSHVADHVEIRESRTGVSPTVKAKAPKARRKARNAASSASCPGSTSTPRSASNPRNRAATAASTSASRSSLTSTPIGSRCRIRMLLLRPGG